MMAAILLHSNLVLRQSGHEAGQVEKLNKKKHPVNRLTEPPLSFL